jgi:hypothetical protein
MILGRLLLGFVLLAIAIQLIRPARTNPPENPAKTIYASLKVDPALMPILERSCKDCHSNRTVWPWYSGVAPASWMVIHHVNEGREKMNFSEWGGYDADQTQAFLGRMCREVSQDHMPLSSYTLIHRNAFLSDADRQAICNWTQRVAH